MTTKNPVMWLSLAALLVLAGCGERPTDVPPRVEPEHPPAPVAPPAPQVTPPPTTPEAVPAPTAPEAELPADLETVDETFRVPRCRICEGRCIPCEATFAKVSLPSEPSARALAQRVRADMLAFATDMDEVYSFEMKCTSTLARETLVSYRCFASSLVDERGSPDVVPFALTYAVNGASVRKLEAEDALVDGALFDDLVESVCAGERVAGLESAQLDCETEFDVAFSADGFEAFVSPDAEHDLIHVPYAALGTLLRPDGPLTVLPGALDAVAVTTPLATEFAPLPTPATVRAFGEPGTLTAQAIAWRRGGSDLLGLALPRSEADLAPVDVRMILRFGTTTAPPGLPPPVEVPHPGMTLDVSRAVLTRAITLRAAPGARGPGVRVCAGTEVVLVAGRIGARDAVVGPGQWVYAVASEQAGGWTPGASAFFRRSLSPFDGSVEATLRESVDEAERATLDVRTLTLTLQRRTATAALATRADGARSWLFVAERASPSAPGAVWLRLTLDGRIDDVLVGKTAESGGQDLLYVTTEEPGAPPGSRHWRAYALGPSEAPDAVAPALDATWLSATGAPARDAVRVLLGATRSRQFVPLTVRARGAVETKYTWTGSALEAPGVVAAE